MTPRQMVAFGEMYLNARASSNGQQDRSGGVGRGIVRAAHGLTAMPATIATATAGGCASWRGQACYRLGLRRAVHLRRAGRSISWSSPHRRARSSQERRSHLRTIYDIVEEFVVAPVASLTKVGWSYTRVS